MVLHPTLRSGATADDQSHFDTAFFPPWGHKL